MKHPISFSLGLDGRNILCKTQNHSFQGNELSVNSSETISLNCSIVQGGRARQITWTKKDTTVNSQRLFTVSSAPAPGLWSSLRLSNISVGDSGTYQCEVKKNRKRDVCYVVLHVYCKQYASILVHQALVSPEKKSSQRLRRSIENGILNLTYSPSRSYYNQQIS